MLDIAVAGHRVTVVDRSRVVRCVLLVEEFRAVGWPNGRGILLVCVCCGSRAAPRSHRSHDAKGRRGDGVGVGCLAGSRCSQRCLFFLLAPQPPARPADKHQEQKAGLGGGGLFPGHQGPEGSVGTLVMHGPGKRVQAVSETARITMGLLSACQPHTFDTHIIGQTRG